MIPDDAVFALTMREMRALHGLGERAMALYVVLRSMMDYRTGVVGRPATISLDGLSRELLCVTNKGKGMHEERPTKKQVIVALERLVTAGLLSRQKTEMLVFSMPKALVASARHFHTGHREGTELSTDQGTDKRSSSAGFRDVLGTENYGQCCPNSAHIKGVRVYTSQSSSTPGRGVAPGDAGAEGVNRDRAAPSQAGSLGRPGKPHGDPDRDRPAGSHVGPWGADSDASHRDRPPASHPALPHRLEAGPDAGDAYPDGQWPTNARSSAKKDSLADGMAAAAAPDAQLRAVLGARGIREDLLGVVDDWAGHGVTPDELAAAIDKARAARIAAGSTQPIPLKYVAKVVANNRAAARRAVERLEGRAPRAARGGVGDLEALALQLGIAGARPGESTDQFRARVQVAHQQVRGDGQA